MNVFLYDFKKCQVRSLKSLLYFFYGCLEGILRKVVKATSLLSREEPYQCSSKKM